MAVFLSFLFFFYGGGRGEPVPGCAFWLTEITSIPLVVAPFHYIHPSYAIPETGPPVSPVKTLCSHLCHLDEGSQLLTSEA